MVTVRHLRRSVVEMASVAEPPTDASTALPTWERLEALYRSSRDDVYAYVATLLRDRAAAEDVVATTFERAYRKRRAFDRRRGDERAWLFGLPGCASRRTLGRSHDTPPPTRDQDERMLDQLENAPTLQQEEAKRGVCRLGSRPGR